MSPHLKVENKVVADFAHHGDLSTDIALGTDDCHAAQSIRFRNDRHRSAELCFHSSAWHSVCLTTAIIRAVDAGGERKESATQLRSLIVNPNGKESQNRTHLTLLNRANTAAMAPIESNERRSSVRPGVKVMDRDAESAAGGYDAI